MQFMNCNACQRVVKINNTGICLGCQRGFTGQDAEDLYKVCQKDATNIHDMHNKEAKDVHGIFNHDEIPRPKSVVKQAHEAVIEENKLRVKQIEKLEARQREIEQELDKPKGKKKK